MGRKPRIRHHPLVGVFAGRLRERRRALGLSRQALAAESSLNAAYLGRLERGEVSPGLDMIARLAEALTIDPAELIAATPDDGDPARLIRKLAETRFAEVVGHGDPTVLQSLAVLLAAIHEGLARRG